MSNRSFACASLVIAFIALCVSAKAAEPLLITAIKGDNVAVYDEAGNFKEERPKATFFAGRDLASNPIPVLQQNDKGLLQIDDGTSKIWLGEDDVKITNEKKSEVSCSSSPVRARVSDTVAASAMGLSNCK